MKKTKKPFDKNRLLIYGILILSIAYFFTKQSIDFSRLDQVQWSGKLLNAIGLAIIMLCLRDLGYVLRMRLLTDFRISFWHAVRIILLWEFGSAITPGMVGGKAVAIYLLIKNKIHAAQASSIVLLSILLDEAIFIALFPIFYLIIGSRMLHGDPTCPDWIALRAKMPILDNIHYLETTILVMLSIVIVFVMIAFVGIFIYPKWIKNRLIRLSKITMLHRWQESMCEFADQLYHTSYQIKKKSPSFWLQLFLYTLLSWAGRYMVGVAIVWGFSTQNFDWVEVYTKQYALWLMFYIPSTPGSTGIAEALYMAFYCSYIQSGMAGAAAFVWRLISYYIYLVVGLILLSSGNKNQRIDV